MFYEGFTNITKGEIMDTDCVLKRQFITNVANNTKASQFELIKEEKVDMVIDLYGHHEKLFHHFED